MSEARERGRLSTTQVFRPGENHRGVLLSPAAALAGIVVTKNDPRKTMFAMASEGRGRQVLGAA